MLTSCRAIGVSSACDSDCYKFLNLRVHAIHLLRVDLDVRDNVCPGLICTALHDALPHVRLHEAAELVYTDTNLRRAEGVSKPELTLHVAEGVSGLPPGILSRWLLYPVSTCADCMLGSKSVSH